ncbi:MAG: radical SAM family heme chaperone HemW [Deltaproteobacteria bacterium]|nr:MAG: radical SAM family heme chaperone HemW [Deltaproteobacteria bacterium]
MSWGLYLHVPWCQVHCPYCGFYVEVERTRAPWETFGARLVDEVRWRARRHGFEGPARTVYFGGGTPSRMPVAVLREVLAALDFAEGAEVTLEANPEDVHPQWLEAVCDAGVNRISLGVQTLNPARAKRLGRAASLRQARGALDLLRQAPLRSWSADLIFATPGQTVDELDEDLDALLAFEPPHVSVYGLTIEPDTGFEKLRDQGRLQEVDPDRWRALHDRLLARLEAAGIPRYEVSNFARPGHESRHNALYWQDVPYLGAGPSAHGYGPRRERWMNLADVHAWLSTEDPTLEEEGFEPWRYAADLLISGMRGVQGVELARLHAVGLWPNPDIVNRLCSAGLLDAGPERLALTTEGFPVSDAVVRTLIESLRPL